MITVLMCGYSEATIVTAAPTSAICSTPHCCCYCICFLFVPKGFFFGGGRGGQENVAQCMMIHYGLHILLVCMSMMEQETFFILADYVASTLWIRKVHSLLAKRGMYILQKSKIMFETRLYFGIKSKMFYRTLW